MFTLHRLNALEVDLEEALALPEVDEVQQRSDLQRSKGTVNDEHPVRLPPRPRRLQPPYDVLEILEPTQIQRIAGGSSTRDCASNRSFQPAGGGQGTPQAANCALVHPPAGVRAAAISSGEGITSA